MESLALPCLWRCHVPCGYALYLTHAAIARLSWRLLNSPSFLYLSISLAVNSEKGRVIAGDCG